MRRQQSLKKWKYWDKTLKKNTENRILKVRNSLLELAIIPSIDYMGKFEDKEMMKKRSFAKNTWYDWLINYVSKPLKNDGWC